MNEGAKYVKIVEWSDEDNCFIGSCPELFYGGCHGEDQRAVFAELCQIVESTIHLYHKDRKSLPAPLSGRELVNRLQRSHNAQSGKMNWIRAAEQQDGAHG